MKPNCIKAKTLDKTAQLCLWCEDRETVERKTNELEQSGYSVIRGICPVCIEYMHADSLKGTHWELRYV
jgi:hypothetical protein